MREQFIDAADWVMVPNIIGMATHADGGVLMTKPYAAGGAYIKRMGRYCGGYRFDPAKRTGEDACPFTTLYWDFLDRHQDTFAKNHRMAQQFAGLKRLSDLDEVRERARDVLAGLSEGLDIYGRDNIANNQIEGLSFGLHKTASRPTDKSLKCCSISRSESKITMLAWRKALQSQKFNECISHPIS